MRQKLFTKQIDDMLFKQYPLGNDLSKQKVVTKIFNPYGNGTYYLINSDPNDPDYLWAIVDLFDVEVGSVSREDLQTIKVPPFGLNLERDMYFQPINAQELLDGLRQGKTYADGGATDITVISDKSDENFLVTDGAKPSDMTVKLAKGGVVSTSDVRKELQKLGYSETVSENLVNKYSDFVKDAKSAYSVAKEIDNYEEDKQSKYSYGNGGTLDVDDLVGKTIHVYMAGVKEPVKDKIVSVKVTPENYSHRDVTVMTKDGGQEKFPLSKLDDFMRYQKIQAKDSKGEPYAIELCKTKYADGGKIKDQYEGRTPEDIWNNLSKVQRQHFIYDHADQIENYRGEEHGELTSREIIKAYNSSYSELDKNIKNRFDNHVKEGQYGNGGMMAKGGKTTFKDKVKSISQSLLKRKKVSKSVQKDYGKTYNKAEAVDSAKRIAGAMRAKEMAKKKR